jgi:SAM-dependent methyltransferase
MLISYGHSDRVFRGYRDDLLELIRAIGPQKVVEIGGGAVPAIPLSDLSDLGIEEYAVLDISKEELEKAPAGYTKLVFDICEGQPPSGFDLAISHYLAEHVPNAQKFHQNVFRMLNPGGRAFHCFPTMFSLPYLANLLIPEGIGQKMVTWTDRNRQQSGTQGKFPAKYKWCFGPTRSNIARFKSLGYEVESYQGFFGHYYYGKIPPLHWLHRMKTSLLLKHPIPQLTTVAYVVLRKPSVN